MTHHLEVIRAGAGAGKTTDLCKTVAEAVASGLDPARILATTFTKKAASELKGRIQARLLSADGDTVTNQRNADRLELAAIGTVHSVAHMLLSRYAVEVGLSPQLEVMTEEASHEIVAAQLSRLPQDEWASLVELAERLGINDLHSRLLKLLAEKRSNGIDDDDFAYQMQACGDRVCELLAASDHLHETPQEQLLELLTETLETIGKLKDSTDKTDNAKKKLREIRSSSVPVWGKYAESSRVTAGKSSGADQALDTLRNHAADVRRNRRLHDDVRQFSQLLANHTLQIEAGYRSHKLERGLVDFTDLEILLLDLLTRDSLVDLISHDFDLILVDEFQDTNPLQLAIFQAMRRAAPRNRWVGDPKQAIYGFRSTDPSLVNRVWDEVQGAFRDTLPYNYRSQKGLVDFIGQVFSPLLGEDAVQEAAKPGKPRGIERWLFDTKNQEQDAFALATGVLQLNREGVQFGDMAVLERANAQLPKLAAAFDQLQIPYLYQSPGLFDTREGTAVLAGLRLVLDRNDSLAAAIIKHVLGDPDEETPAWIFERLKEIRSKREAVSDGEARIFRHPWEGDDLFLRLEQIDRKKTSPHSVCQLVMEALDMPQQIAHWGDAAQRASNLDSILRHVAEYESLMLGNGQAATLGGSILYLEQLASDSSDIKYPPIGHDAVTLMTYHSAKGLQWPVVILSGLDSDRSPNVWEPSVGGGGDDIDNPLLGRTIQAWIWPFGMTDGFIPRLRSGTGLENDALDSAEGQAKRVREAEENLRLLYVGSTRAETKLIFAHRVGKYAWLKRAPEVDRLLDPSLEEGEYPVDGCDTTLVIRELSGNGGDGSAVSRDLERWLALPEHVPGASSGEPRFRSPSVNEVTRPGVSVELVTMEGRSYFPSALKEEEYAAMGDAVHRYLAALPSMKQLSAQAKQQIAGRCLSAYSMSGKISSNDLVEVGERFVAWVDEHFPNAVWRSEASASAPRQAGGTWNGMLDLILELPSNDLVVIDHKSAPIRRSQCEAKAVQYSGQLEAYQEILESLGSTIHSCWIHFPLAGMMVRVNEG